MSVAPLPSISCADIAPTSVSWLWEPYLARGKLAILDGDPEAGKSIATIDIAARISRGSPMPDGVMPGRSGTVLLLCAEDEGPDTIQPRVAAAGADAVRVRVVSALGLGLERFPQFPADLTALAESIREHDAALVIIDPMMAFFPPEVSANNDQSIRKALTPMAALAAETGAAILFVRHLRKSGGPNAIYRGAGSIGIMGAMRTGLMISRHPDDQELRVMAQTKSNIGPIGPSFAFRLERNEITKQAFVDWTGRLDLSAQDLCGGGAPARAGRVARDRATEWLRQFLADGPRRTVDVQLAANAAGFASRTLDRAKEALRVRSEAVREGDKTVWWWRDPAAPKASVASHFRPLPQLEPLPKLAELDDELKARAREIREAREEAARWAGRKG